MPANKNYASSVLVPPRRTMADIPQTSQAHPLQERNSAGGFSFALSPSQRVLRFLILGSASGSYYSSPRALTAENCLCAVQMAKSPEDHKLLVDLLVDVSDKGRAPKQDPGLMALAIAIVHAPNVECKKYAFSALTKVCRVPTTLFGLIEFIEAASKASQGSTGWGRGMRKAVARWYQSRDGLKLCMDVTKYKQRGGWSHKDVLRLAHVNPGSLADDGARLALMYAVKGSECLQGVGATESNHSSLEFLQAVESAKLCSDGGEMVDLIKDGGLVREHIPTQLLGSVEVWRSLLVDGRGMPVEAMIRNLPKMTAVGLFESTAAVDHVVAVLGDAEKLKRARVHPLKCLIASKVYKSGKGEKGSLQWVPVSRIVAALEGAFQKAFGAVQPSGKNMLLALDVSGSMSWNGIPGTSMMCSEASAAMALVTAATEPSCRVMGFSSQFVDLNIYPTDSLSAVMGKVQGKTFGSTDCGLPMKWARENRVPVDCFVVYTDNETYAGARHPHVELELYRSAMGIPARLVVVGMVSNSFSIANPEDGGMLDVVGFDTATPDLIGAFARGEF